MLLFVMPGLMKPDFDLPASAMFRGFIRLQFVLAANGPLKMLPSCIGLSFRGCKVF